MNYFLNTSKYQILLSVGHTSFVEPRIDIYDLSNHLDILLQESNLPYLSTKPIVFDKSYFIAPTSEKVYLHNLYELVKMKYPELLTFSTVQGERLPNFTN